MTRIIRVLAPNPGPFTLEGTNTWVVGERPAVVIDPGPDDPGHLRAVREAAGAVSAILLTHRHPDHASGAQSLAAAVGAPVLAFAPRGRERPLRPGDVVRRLRVIHAPGHTPDHVTFLLEPERFLFTGDAVLGRGTSIVSPPEGDMGAYVRSLAELRDVRPRALYPGHGPLVFDGPGRLEAYLRHRAYRERQVLAAVGRGRQTADQMVPEIYGDAVSPAMFPAAARSVLAHLLKLEREGRVARTGRVKDARFVPVRPKDCERCGRPANPGSRYCDRCGLAVLQEGPGPGPE